MNTIDMHSHFLHAKLLAGNARRFLGLT